MNVIKVRWLCKLCSTRIIYGDSGSNNVDVVINSMEELIDAVNIHHIIHVDTCPLTEKFLRLPNNFQKLNIISPSFGIYYFRCDDWMTSFISSVIIDNVFSKDYKIYTINNEFNFQEFDIHSNNDNKTILVNIPIKNNSSYVSLIKNLVPIFGHNLTSFYGTIYQINKSTQTKTAIK